MDRLIHDEQIDASFVARLPEYVVIAVEVIVVVVVMTFRW